jgi:glycyl-tRNA synthetase beta chain
LIEKALADLPIPRRMRWGDGEAEFVRPVHWVVLLHGTDVIEGSVMGIPCGNTTMGHRFHSSGPIRISKPSAYLQTLEEKGHVIADFDIRRKLVMDGVDRLAKKASGHVVDGEALYDEVAALVEWPVPVLGGFDEAFLELPREVVVSTLTGHQRYFPIAGDNDALLPCFVTVANLESKEPDKVRDGNERVIRPRLADAAFFWDSDRRKALSTRQEALRDVVYQRGLGSLYDKSMRTAEIATVIAASLEMDSAAVERAAGLCKCDLLTGMVGEFPDLQGTMGRYYAISDGEPDIVATAIGEHYQPRFAGDALPETDEGRVLAIADRLDTLAGIFTIGKKPSGNRDPFGLRRAALGVIRLSIECGLDLDLKTRGSSQSRYTRSSPIACGVTFSIGMPTWIRRHSTPSWRGNLHRWSISSFACRPYRPSWSWTKRKAWRPPTSASPTFCGRPAPPRPPISARTSSRRTPNARSTMRSSLRRRPFARCWTHAIIREPCGSWPRFVSPLTGSSTMSWSWPMMTT